MDALRLLLFLLLCLPGLAQEEAWFDALIAYTAPAAAPGGPPILSAISITTTNATDAVAGWTTDISANSTVEFGTDTGYGTSTNLATLQTSHSIGISNLTGNTVYHFRVSSTNGTGQSAVSPDQAFVSAAYAAIVYNALGSNVSTSNYRTNQTTDNCTGHSNSLLLAFAVSSLANWVVPTNVNGLGVTWVLAYSTNYNSGGEGISIWRSMTNNTPVVGKVTVMYAANQTGNGIRVCEFQNVVTSGANGADALVQVTSATGAVANASVTLGALHYLGKNSAACFFGNVIGSGGAWGTAKSGWTEDYDAGYATPSVGVYEEYALLTSDNAPSVTSSAAQWAGIAVEAKSLNTRAVTPTISNVAVSATNSTSATIAWTTDQADNGTVQWGLNTSYGSAISNLTAVSSHSIVISPLTELTTYHYRVSSTNTDNLNAVSGDNSFATPATPAAPSYVVSLGRMDETASGSTTVLNTTNSAAVGSRVVVLLAWKNPTAPFQTLSSVADARGNTYAINALQTNVSQAYNQLAVASASVTTALLSNDTITATWGSPINIARNLQACCITNVTGLDVSATNTSYSSTVTATATTTAANIAVGIVDAQSLVYTPAWTQIGATDTQSSENVYFLYKANAASGSLDIGGTISASDAWSTTWADYK